MEDFYSLQLTEGRIEAKWPVIVKVPTQSDEEEEEEEEAVEAERMGDKPRTGALQVNEVLCGFTDGVEVLQDSAGVAEINNNQLVSLARRRKPSLLPLLPEEQNFSAQILHIDPAGVVWVLPSGHPVGSLQAPPVPYQSSSEDCSGWDVGDLQQPRSGPDQSQTIEDLRE